MNKKVFFSIIAVTVIILAYIVVQAKSIKSYSKAVQYLIILGEHNEGAKATDFYYSAAFTDKDKDDLVRLIDNYNEKLPPMFIMRVADHIYKKDKDKAVLYYYIGRLRAKEDVLMCTDTTARQQIYVYPQAAPDTINYASKRIFEKNDKEYLADVLQKALDWDKKHQKRFNSVWACGYGIDAFFKEPTLVDEEKQKEIIEKERNDIEKIIAELKDKNSPPLEP